jgi:hypothetical protein
MLTNMLHYAEKQAEKSKLLSVLFYKILLQMNQKGRDKDLDKFISPNTYLWSTLIQNLSFSSTVFRHSYANYYPLVGFIIGNTTFQTVIDLINYCG